MEFCPSAPSTYSDITQNACVAQCSSGRYALDLTRDCVLICPEQSSTFASPGTRKCVATCPASEAEFAMLANRTCMTNCGAGFFAH